MTTSCTAPPIPKKICELKTAS